MASGGTVTKTQRFSAPDASPAYFVDALKDIGLQEWVLENRRRVPNPTVVRYMEKGGAGRGANSMKIPWCAYYVNAKLEYNGVKSTKRGNARSYLGWGYEIQEEDWQVGDIVVFWRGRVDDGVTGHVGFLVKWDAKYLYILGGNQGDQVNISRFTRDKLLSVRMERKTSQSRIVRSTAGSAVSGAASKVVDSTHDALVPKANTVVEVATESKGIMEMMVPWLPWVAGVLAAVSIGLAVYALYCRIQDKNKNGE
jgi:uncharacterized protein (TIGR02594 family)